MMRQIHRLRPLQMSVTRQQHVSFFFNHGEDGPLRCLQAGDDLRTGGLEIQPHIRRHLIVSAPRRVQFSGRRHALGQRLFDVHVHIFQLLGPFKFALFNLIENGF